MDQGNSCVPPMVPQGPGTLPSPCRMAVALSTGVEKVPVALREIGLSRGRKRYFCMESYMCVLQDRQLQSRCLSGSYIIISTFRSLDTQGKMAGCSECSEHFREGNHMLFWPVLNEKCPHYFETLRVPKGVGAAHASVLKRPPASPGACPVSCVCTDHSKPVTLGDSRRGQPWSTRSRSTKTIFSRR